MYSPYGQTQFPGQYGLQFQYPTHPQYPQYPQQYPYYYYPQVQLLPIPNPFFNNPANIQPCRQPQINSSSYQRHHNSSLGGRRVEQIPFVQQGIPHASFEIKSAASNQVEEPIHLGRSARQKQRQIEEMNWGPNDLLKFANRGSSDCVQKVLDLGIDPNFTNREHQTALHFAAIKNWSGVIETLVNYEKINKKAYKIDKHIYNVYGKTPLACAIERGNDDAVAALVTGVDDANYLERESLSPLDHVFNRNNKELSQLSKSIKIAKILFENGADLGSCAFFKSDQDTLSVIEVCNILKAAGFDSSVINSHLPKNLERFNLPALPKPAQTALTESTNHCEEPVDIKMAEERHVEKKQSDVQEKEINYFHRMVSEGNLKEVTKRIERLKSHINAQNSDGCSALLLAAFHNQPKMTEILLQVENINKHLPNNKGETPLFFAIINRNRSLVKMLVSNPGDANYIDQHGLTPLDYTFKPNRCSFKTTLKVVKFLVRKGAEFEKCSYFNPNFTATKGFLDKKAVEEILHAALVDKSRINLLLESKDLKS